MTAVALNLACGDYDRTRALWDGTVRPEGIDLNYLKIGSGEGFWRQLHDGAFDASEMSMSALIMLVGRGDDRFVGIPAFTSRAFRHGCIFVNVASGIRAPEDLKGRRVGVPQYHMTAALWIRGILLHEYGVGAEDIEWIQGGLDRAGYPERVQLDLPASIHVTSAADRALAQLLVDGEIDAIIGAEWPEPMRNGDPRVAHLFPNYRQVEADYYRKTGFFPIMHCIGLRRDIYERYPWVAMNLYTAFEEAKQRAFINLGFPGTLKYMLPWLASDYLDVVHLMGADYWRYGVERSRAELEVMCQFSFEQGLAPRVVAVEELFAPETLHPFPFRRDP